MTTKTYDKDFEEWAQRWQLDDEEKEILAESERGEWKPLQGKEAEETKARLKAAAYYTLEKMKKSQSISIRLAPTDLVAIKAKAQEEGLPYQTLISSIIHKYALKK